jgi:hypothetical protein
MAEREREREREKGERREDEMDRTQVRRTTVCERASQRAIERHSCPSIEGKE